MKILVLKFAAAVFFSAAFLLLLLSTVGCSDQERMGLSPIPQNSPGSWEFQPYGPIRN